jgi:diguanylate cyclase (GGDEF)-like protein
MSRPVGFYTKITISRDREMEQYKETDFPVLVVEDDEVARRILEHGLRRGGYEVYCADNGQKALEMLDTMYFPIVITDWLMPEMDGLELCKAIRSKDSNRYTYIIFVTVKGSEDDMLRGLDAGADEYLPKPFNSAELTARIKTAQRILAFERALQEEKEKNRKDSITDALTGAYNRVYLTERLPQEIARTKRYQHPLSVILLDIDHFKMVNDSFGHLAGDLVLKEFVGILQGQVRRDIDWVTRFGGEEFLIVLPETSGSAALIVAERLRMVIESIPIQVKERDQVFITASLGVATVGTEGGDRAKAFDSLIEKADQSLDRAKHECRNKVAGPVERLIV